MRTFEVNCSKQYNVYFEKGLIQGIKGFLSNSFKGHNILIIADDNVDPLYSDIVLNQLADNYTVKKLVLKHGEETKNIDNLYHILTYLAQNRFKRNDLIIALGGGVIGDISGLSASLYMRGIDFLQIPTTLLAMVDASIGGKTAIDLPEGKNLVGSFYQPLMVICDPDIIRKLPEPIFNEGMAEVIKYNVIDKNRIIEYVNNDLLEDKLEEVIEKCIEIKTEIVSKDEFEKTGLRRLLNAGHTFAHALENISNYSISHGRAVGTGLVYEAALANYLGYCEESTLSQIAQAVCRFDLLLKFDYDFDDLVDYMKADKKNDSGLISFILPERLGKCREIKMELSELKQAFKQIGVYDEKD